MDEFYIWAKKNSSPVSGFLSIQDRFMFGRKSLLELSYAASSDLSTSHNVEKNRHVLTKPSIWLYRSYLNLVQRIFTM